MRSKVIRQTIKCPSCDGVGFNSDKCNPDTPTESRVRYRGDSYTFVEGCKQCGGSGDIHADYSGNQRGSVRAGSGDIRVEIEFDLDRPYCNSCGKESTNDTPSLNLNGSTYQDDYGRTMWTGPCKRCLGARFYVVKTSYNP